MRKQIIFLFCLWCVGIGFLRAQLPLGEWQACMAYGVSSMSVALNGKVYALSEGSLFSYNPEDGDILTYDKVSPLSDVEIAHIAACPSRRTLVIVYANGNIDLMDAEENVYNITDLKNSTVVSEKTINDVVVEGDRAYLSADFGVVVLDVARREVAVSYILSRKVKSCAVVDGALFIAVPNDGLYKGVLSDNLLDFSKWTRLRTNTFSKLIVHNGVLYGYIPGHELLTLDTGTGNYERVLEGNLTHFNVVDGRLAVGDGAGRLWLFSSPTERVSLDVQQGITDISYGSSLCWVSSDSEGLSGYSLSGDGWKVGVSPIKVNAPKYNLFYRMLMHNGKLYTCGGGIFLAPYYNPGVIQVMNENGEWHTYDNVTPAVQGGGNFMDVTSIAVDPHDENHLFASTGGWGGNSAVGGVYEFMNGEYVERYTPENSTIHPVEGSPKVIYPDGLKYDAEGNLWVLCAFAETSISVYTKEKKWISISHEELNGYTLRGTLFDQRGWMWYVSPNYDSPGIYILDYNGTLETTSDDRAVCVNTFINQDGEKLVSGQVYCIVEDLSGDMWIGTNNGPLLITDPARLLNDGNNSTTLTQVKIPRNDGTNFADYLLEGTTIISMAVDGANRKWVGTERNGVFLLSADGQEELLHFTTEDSPLPSNEIQDIVVDHRTGLVYFGTSKGLIAYQSDATEAQSSFSESNVRAYPNPVRPDYQGYVTIVGLMANSQVKITDSYGSLIHEGTSTGGSFSWNGRNAKGNRVASGVYHVMATDEAGEEGIVTKIVVVK